MTMIKIILLNIIITIFQTTSVGENILTSEIYKNLEGVSKKVDTTNSISGYDIFKNIKRGSLENDSHSHLMPLKILNSENANWDLENLMSGTNNLGYRYMFFLTGVSPPVQ